MTKNPFLNALATTLYITAIASMMFYGPKIENGQPTVFILVAMISLLTMSVAIMGFIFFYQPFQMYFTEKKKAALNFCSLKLF